MSAYDGPKPPGRPSVPPILWALLSAIVAAQTVLRMQIGTTRCLDAIVIIVFASCVTAAICAIWEKTPQARFILVVAASFCAAALSASFVVETSRAAVAELRSSPVSEWSFLVTGDARFTQDRFRTRARARKAGSISTDVWLYSDERLYPGMTVRGVGRMKTLVEGEWAEASHAQGITAQISILKVDSLEPRCGPLGVLDDLRRRAISSIRPSANVTRALLAACTLGDRTGIDELGSDEVLRRCGISHLVAVSGTHLALVAGACTELLDRLALHPRVRAAVLGCATGIFVLLCGAPPSAVRAWLMVLSAIAGQTVGRRSHGTSSLSAAALAMALLDPTVTGQLAYQLSVAAVLGIRIIYPYLRYIVEAMFTSRRSRYGRIASLLTGFAPFSRRMRDLVAMTVTAQVVTLPITAASFGELSVIAPISNLIAAVPISVLTLAGLASIVLLPVPLVSEALLYACSPVGNLLMRILSVLSGFRWAAIPIEGHATAMGLLVLIALLILAWHSPKVTRAGVLIPILAIGCTIAVWYGANRYLAPARFCVLDVGQGDAILVQEGPYAVLVDAGPAGGLEPALSRLHILHLDAVMLSHLHNDHYGGIADLPDAVACEEIIVPYGSAQHAPAELAEAADTLGISRFEEIGCGDEIAFGHFTITVLAPFGEVDGLENEDSQFLLVSYDDGRRTLTALLTGDGESGELASVLDRCGLSGVDILKVGHHGSSGSITSSQAAELDPAFALCSAGYGNEFGHPDEGTVEALEAAGSVFLCTIDEGDIVMVPSADGACRNG